MNCFTLVTYSAFCTRLCAISSAAHGAVFRSVSTPVPKSISAARSARILCLQDNNSNTKYFDFVVVGSGVAGLRYALEVSKHGSVAIITKAEPHESNTNYAQGGVSAVLCPSDSVESHMQDTIVAGAHLCDEETVRVSFLVFQFDSLFRNMHIILRIYLGLFLLSSSL